MKHLTILCLLLLLAYSALGAVTQKCPICKQELKGYTCQRLVKGKTETVCFKHAFDAAMKDRFAPLEKRGKK